MESPNELARQYEKYEEWAARLLNPSVGTNVFRLPLVCARSGLFLGDFLPSNGLAKTTPYVKGWKTQTFLHPIYSQTLSELLHRAMACYQLEKTGTIEFPMQHKQLLMSAMLHASGCIHQDVPGLPNAKITETHFAAVIEMLGWRQDVSSDRLHFPRLHIWKGAAQEDAGNLFRAVPVWLGACAAVQEEFNSVVRTKQKEAKKKAHAMALKNIRRAMYDDISLRKLWTWIAAYVPASELENNPDYKLLFFSSEGQIQNWTHEDIENLETVFLEHCETGNSVSHEVSKRLNQLREWLHLYEDTFEIEVDTEAFKEHRGMPEPVRASFKSNAAFLVAQAKWNLGNKEVADIQQELGEDEL